MRYPYSPLYGLIALVMLTLGACEKEPEVLSETQAHVLLDLPYGTDSKQKMDVYLPGNRSTEETKVAIFIHGGAFMTGDRKDVERTIIDRFVSQGWAVANISYRLVNGYQIDAIPPARIDSDILIKDQVADVSAAVDYVLAHAREWAVNGHRIGVVGHSAGGTLAILYAYSDHNTAGKVKAVGNLAGAVDLAFTQYDVDNVFFTKLFIPEFMHRVTGHPFMPWNTEHSEPISPYHVVHATKPVPIINVFPENNIVLLDLPRQDRATYNRFTSRLDELGIPNHFVQINGVFHDFGGAQTQRQAIDETVTFFNEHLQ